MRPWFFPARVFHVKSVSLVFRLISFYLTSGIQSQVDTRLGFEIRLLSGGERFGRSVESDWKYTFAASEIDGNFCCALDIYLNPLPSNQWPPVPPSCSCFRRFCSLRRCCSELRYASAASREGLTQPVVATGPKGTRQLVLLRLEHRRLSIT